MVCDASCMAAATASVLRSLNQGRTVTTPTNWYACRLLLLTGAVYSVCLCFAVLSCSLAEHVDFVACLGGDGVILHASSLFKSHIPPVVSFHLGSMGFLTNHNFNEFRQELRQVGSNRGCGWAWGVGAAAACGLLYCGCSQCSRDSWDVQACCQGCRHCVH